MRVLENKGKVLIGPRPRRLPNYIVPPRLCIFVYGMVKVTPYFLESSWDIGLIIQY